MNDATDMSSISSADWAVVGLFMAMIIGMAMWVKFRQNGTEDFFLAGRSMGWGVVMFSTFATLFSTISFVSAPGEAYKNGLMMSLITPATILFYPLAIALFLRFYLLSGTFTVFEYLEKRYNVSLRLYGSLTYSIGRILYGGSVFYAASKIFYSLVGWDPVFTIIAVGIFTIAYCATGGMKAVMITDVVQGVIVIIGIAAIFLRILQVADFDLTSICGFAAQHGKAFGALSSADFYDFGLNDRFSFWILLYIAIYTPIMYVSCDQSLIQRLMAAKSYKLAKRGIYGNLILTLPVIAMLWLLGTGMFYYYGQNPKLLPDTLEADHVLGYFVKTQLPTPLPGLITAALLAALMSTVDSTVNCIANVVHNDWLVRFGIVKSQSKHELLICRLLSIASGILCVGLAVLLVLANRDETKTVFDVVKVVGAVAGGPLFLAFLFGVLSKRVSSKAMFIGLIIGWISNIIMVFLFFSAKPHERPSCLVMSAPAIILTPLVTVICTMIWPNRKRLTDLTLWTLTKRDLREAEAQISCEQ